MPLPAEFVTRCERLTGGIRKNESLEHYYMEYAGIANDAIRGWVTALDELAACRRLLRAMTRAAYENGASK